MQKPKQIRDTNYAVLQPMQSVTNLKYAQPSFMEPFHSSFESDTNINQSRANKQLRIGIEIDKSGLPSYVRSQVASRLKLVPLFLFSIFRQFHILYLLVLSGIMPLKYLCFQGYEWQIFSLHLLLVLIYIILECFSRYLMLKSLTKFEGNKGTEYEIWRNETKTWEVMEEKQIKVGQVIRVKPKNILMTDDDNDELLLEKKIRISVNLLPIKCSSGKNSIQIDTFDMNKEEERTVVQIDPRFKNYLQDESDIIDFSIRNCKISYFFSHFGNQQFQALLEFQNLREQKKLSSTNIITNGAYLCDEQYVIGVVLFSLQSQRLSYLRYMLLQKNKIKLFLGFHLFKVIIWICIMVVILLALNTILSGIIFGEVNLTSYHCYTFNYISIFSFSMNVVLYIAISIHHLWDSHRIKKYCNIKVNNYIKTMDEFGMADAFLFDEFTFVKKNVLFVSQIQTNLEPSLEIFNQKIIIYLIKNSNEFKRRFPKQWLSLSYYYKEDAKQNFEIYQKLREQIKIEDQIIDISGAVRLIACFKHNKRGSNFYIIRFNQRIIFSALESISQQKKQKFADKIMQGKKNGELMIMAQILQLDESYEIDLSLNTYQLQYKFYCLIRMKFVKDKTGSDFVRKIKNKYNIVIMTSSPLQYFDQVLVTTGLKNNNFITLIFQEAEQTAFLNDLERRINQIKSQTLQNFSNERYSNKNLIIALDSSLIIYLAKQKTRDLVKQIAEHSTYLIFFNTSQFQKQLCATNIFKIFPNHIFISNFAVDAVIFRLSNLSVSIQEHSGNRFSTICTKNYRQLCNFVTNQSPASMELTSIIIKNHIFKNQVFIGSMLLAMFLLYKGTFFYLNTEYSTYIFFVFNFGFTTLPLIFYFVARPKILDGIIIENFNIDMDLKKIHFIGFSLGVFMTYVTYSFIPEHMLGQIYVNILINSIIMGNLHYLVLDNSVEKKWQTIFILIQIIFSLGIIFICQYIPNLPHDFFSFGIVMSPLDSDLVMYFLGSFVFNIVLMLMLFLFISVTKEIVNRQIHLKKKKVKREKQKLMEQENMDKKTLVGKVGRSPGKQMRFRGLNTKNNLY